MCLLADLCNHTWIPECGLERDEQYYRLFLDECDMFEYNCDNQLYFEIRNYSECFDGHGPCPPVKPCPSIPPCPNHAYHRMNDHYIYIRRSLAAPTTPRTPPPGLPKHMFHGKRRYTPDRPIKRRRENCPSCIPVVSTSPCKAKSKQKTAQTRPMKPMTRIRGLTTTFWKTRIIKTSTFMKNGLKMIKIVRGINLAYIKTTKTMNTDDSDFLE